jgi:N-acylglucosamine 2-epimerase
MYENTLKRIKNKNFKTEPYPIPDGYISHGINMILLHTTTEIYKALKKYKPSYLPKLEQKIDEYIDNILNVLCDENYTIRELYNFEKNEELLIESHRTPGHTLESMWFVMDGLNILGKNENEKITKIVKKAYEIGWDKDKGGIFRYVDKNGGKPFGKIVGDRYEELVIDTWDTKLWWPHSEALYMTLRLYLETRDKDIKNLYLKTHDYSFDIFPNIEIGEWIQIRDRDGKPMEKIVALPVKDPYHIMRNIILNIKILGGKHNNYDLFREK